MPRIRKKADGIFRTPRGYSITALLQFDDAERSPPYSAASREGDAKDHEFSSTSMREHWTSGYEDTKRTLKRRDWIRMPDEDMGLVVHDVDRETESA